MDKSELSNIISIGIAEVKVVCSPEQLRTTLGSCVGVAVYDRIAGIGGLAHVILPSSEGCHGDPGKFADTAVDMLIEGALGAGCDRKRLAAKITGGASMFGLATDDGLGERNGRAVRERLMKHGIRLVAEDIGGQKGQKMMLDPATGDVRVQIIGAQPVMI